MSDMTDAERADYWYREAMENSGEGNYKRIAELEAELESTSNNWSASVDDWALEKAKVEKLETKIADEQIRTSALVIDLREDLGRRINNLEEAVRELALLHKEHQEPHYYNGSISKSCPAAWDKTGKCACWVDGQDAEVSAIIEKVLQGKGANTSDR